jgi:hypothetical protein
MEGEGVQKDRCHMTHGHMKEKREKRGECEGEGAWWY